MMWWYDYGHMGSGIVWLIFTMVFWVLLIWLIAYLIFDTRRNNKRPSWEEEFLEKSSVKKSSAESILEERYARWEIDKMEFEAKKKDLRGN